MKHIHVSEDKQFFLHDGSVLRTLHELQEALHDMNPETFRHHVPASHNDFANWIFDIIGGKSLADALRSKKNKVDMAHEIDKQLANAEMEPVQDIHHIKHIANNLRQDLIRMLLEAGSGHSAGPLGMADVFAALYFNILNHKADNPEWDERDRLFLSNGHICPVRYVAMAHAGYFPISELATLRKLGSRLQGHPERERLQGVETTSGPLGSGLAQAAGYAYAARMDTKKFR